MCNLKLYASFQIKAKKVFFSICNMVCMWCCLCLSAESCTPPCTPQLKEIHVYWDFKQSRWKIIFLYQNKLKVLFSVIPNKEKIKNVRNEREALMKSPGDQILCSESLFSCIGGSRCVLNTRTALPQKFAPLHVSFPFVWSVHHSLQQAHIPHRMRNVG